MSAALVTPRRIAVAPASACNAEKAGGCLDKWPLTM